MQGTRTRTKVVTNHFEVTRLPTGDFYQYDVQIEPSAFNARSREIIAKLQSDNPQKFTPRAIYDGGKIAFSTNPKIDTSTFSVALNSQLSFQIRFVQTNKINLSNRNTCIRDGRIVPSVVNLLQLIVKQAPAMRHQWAVRARSFYSADGAKHLGGGLVAWHGFFQSVRPTLKKIMINVDTTTTVMYKHGSLLDVASEFMETLTRGKLDRRAFENLDLNSPDGKKLVRFLKKVKIRVELPSGGSWKRGKPIASLVPRAGSYEFSKDGIPTTVQQHLYETHNYQVRFPRMFGVMIGQSAVFPAEVCTIIPGQFYKKILEEAQRSELVSCSSPRPEERMQSIRNAVTGQHQLFDYANSDFLNSIGMAVSPNPMSIDTQVLPSPEICFQNPRAVQEGGKWNVAGNVLARPAKIASWAVIVFDTKVNPQSGIAQTFVQKLHNNLTQRGVQIHPKFAPGNAFPLSFANPNRWAQSLDELANKATWTEPNGAVHRPNIIVVILPNSAAQLKKQVKYWSTARANIATQCVRSGARKWENANDQYLNNVVLKINVKTGGVNSYVAITDRILNNTMVVGCDVSHPPPSVDSRPSVASVVASVDSRACFYTSKIRVQPPHVEMIQDLRDMVLSASRDYKAFHNAQRPLDHIIVFRDGVSEGEYERVSEMEIKQIEECLDELQKATGMPRPKLTFIIVTKRHHVRFFPSRAEYGDKTGNCPPGLVVNTEIDSGNDFYLQSHGGLKGTSRPSHYIVLRNDMKWTMPQIQELCYYLCHVYAPATRSVSIPAPVYYADRACARAEYHINPDKVEELDANSSVSSRSEFPITAWANAMEPSNLHRYLYFL